MQNKQKTKPKDLQKYLSKLNENEFKKIPILSLLPEISIVAKQWDLCIMETPNGLVYRNNDLKIAHRILVNSIKYN